MSTLRSLLSFAGLMLWCGSAFAGEAILHTIDVSSNVTADVFADGKLLAAPVGTQIYLWDTKTGQEIRRIAPEPAANATSVTFSPTARPSTRRFRTLPWRPGTWRPANW